MYMHICAVYAIFTCNILIKHTSATLPSTDILAYGLTNCFSLPIFLSLIYSGSLGTSNGASKLPVRQVQPDSVPSAEAAPLPEALTTGSTSDGNVGTSDGNVDTSDSNVKADDSPSPDMKVGGNGSDDASVSSMGDDWVNLSHSTHPLNTSND